jgi:acetyl-CoA acetyltransferase
MVLAAVEEAMDEAGIGYADLDAVVTASVDLLDGLAASNVHVTEVVGAVMKPETRIAADGLAAFVHAACQLLAESYHRVLVVAHGKASMAPYWSVTSWAMDPVFLQPMGVDFLVCSALQARQLLDLDPRALERWANTVSLRTRSAPRGLRSAVTPQDVLQSPVVASPIRAHMIAPLGDGAVAVVLEAHAQERDADGIWVKGMGWDHDNHGPGSRELVSWRGLSRAWKRVCRTAGIEECHLDLAEPACWFAHEEDLFLSAVPVEPSTTISPGGGLFAGAAPVAAGLANLRSAEKWLRGRREPGRALVHGSWGPAGQAHVLVLLEKVS